MNCEHIWRVSYKSYRDYKLEYVMYFCDICKEFKEEKGNGEEVSDKVLDEQDKRLDQTVREGKAHGKNINNIRSYMKDGKWQYKYIK